MAAVLLATLVAIILGFLWYGPLFGKAWMATMGITPEQVAEVKAKGMPKTTYPLMILSSLVMAFVLGHVYLFGSTFTGTFGVMGGLSAAFWSWLGFVAPVLLGGVLWEKKSWKWWLILSGYYLVSLLLQGIVFALV